MPPSTAFLTLCLAIVAILTGPVLATADSAHHARGIEVHAHRRGSLPVLPFVSTPASTSLEARAPRRSRQRSSAARKQAHARHADRTRRPANRKKRPATGKSKPKSVKHANKEPAPAPTGGRSNGGLPPSLKQLSDTLAAGKACANTLDSRSGGFNTNGSGRTYPHYCGDTGGRPSVVAWHSNMDVDCDGAPKTGACANDDAHQGMTAFTYNGQYIDALKVPYVVMNQDSTFDPTRFGVQPLATVGVVCGGKLTWAIWADTNEFGNMGEGSVKLAQNCFGSGMTGDSGHDATDVFYFAFTGNDAVDPNGGYNAASLSKLGNSLLSKLS